MLNFNAKNCSYTAAYMIKPLTLFLSLLSNTENLLCFSFTLFVIPLYIRGVALLRCRASILATSYRRESPPLTLLTRIRICNTGT